MNINTSLTNFSTEYYTGPIMKASDCIALNSDLLQQLLYLKIVIVILILSLFLFMLAEIKRKKKK